MRAGEVVRPSGWSTSSGVSGAEDRDDVAPDTCRSSEDCWELSLYPCPRLRAPGQAQAARRPISFGAVEDDCRRAARRSERAPARALELWRGLPLADFAFEDWAQARSAASRSSASSRSRSGSRRTSSSVIRGTSFRSWSRSPASIRCESASGPGDARSSVGRNRRGAAGVHHGPRGARRARPGAGRGPGDASRERSSAARRGPRQSIGHGERGPPLTEVVKAPSSGRVVPVLQGLTGARISPRSSRLAFGYPTDRPVDLARLAVRRDQGTARGLSTTSPSAALRRRPSRSRCTGSLRASPSSCANGALRTS